MTGGSITENTAGVNGGGVYSNWGNLFLHYGEISRNKAAGHGGIFAERFSVLNLSNTVRLHDNSPINRHDSNVSIFRWFITPDIYRFAAIFIIALIGTIISAKRKPKVSKDDTFR